MTRLWREYSDRGKKGQKAAVAIANKMLTIGYFLVRGGNIYNGFDDYSYIRDKLRRENLKDLLPTLEKMLINSNGSHK